MEAPGNGLLMLTSTTRRDRDENDSLGGMAGEVGKSDGKRDEQSFNHYLYTVKNSSGTINYNKNA